MTIHNVALYADVAVRIRHQITEQVEAADPFYPTLAMYMDSTQESEDYDWLGSVPGMREWLGDRKFKQLSSYEFNIKNRDWEQSIQLPKKKIDDGRTGYFDNLGMMLANEASYHPDELLVELINAAETTRCFDGQYFFDTDHEMGDSGTQSNLKTREVVAAATPTKAEIRTIVNASLDDFLGFKGDNGKAIHRPTVNPIDDLLLAVPPKWYSLAVEAFASQLRVESGAAVDNFNIVAPRVVGIQGLGDVIDVYRTNQPLKPFVFQDRQPLGFTSKGEDDREWKDIKVMGDARYNVGVLAWWMAIRNKLETAS
jgi:phage major head subunit gpT-like protein